MSKRYRYLSKRQTEVLTEIAFGNSTPSAPLKTFTVLESAGLIERVADRVMNTDIFGPVSVPQYEMPIHEHIAFCEWCSEQSE